jgi:hypothetical protein
MKKIVLGFIMIGGFISTALAQSDVYTLSSGELIFSGAEVTNSGQSVNTDMRFTCFFHAGQYLHADFNNNLGLYTGLALRNVGIITKDVANEMVLNSTPEKIVRRTYNLGVPLALKLGVFDKGTYVFFGGEYEWLMHYKEKQWINGNKQKSGEWMSDKTKNFVPSVFAGVQFPGGLHLQFKYYLDDFLNHKYKSAYDDYTTLSESRMFYLSVSWQFRPDQLWNKMEKEFFETAQR